MNCKRGDLALVIRGPNAGKVVSCLEALPAGSCNIQSEEGPLWRTDRELVWDSALGRFPGSLAPDWALMPIRPPSGAGTAEKRVTVRG